MNRFSKTVHYTRNIKSFEDCLLSVACTVMHFGPQYSEVKDRCLVWNALYSLSMNMRYC